MYRLPRQPARFRWHRVSPASASATSAHRTEVSRTVEDSHGHCGYIRGE